MKPRFNGYRKKTVVKYLVFLSDEVNHCGPTLKKRRSNTHTRIHTHYSNANVV